MTSSRADLDDLGEAIVAGVERQLPSWVEAQVARIAEAWGRLAPGERAALAERASQAGATAASRVAARLRELFAGDPARHDATPLEIVRSAYREPTAVLEAAGIPDVVRDEFDERAWPDDRYGLVIRTLADLGDDTLGPLLLAWGLAKADVLRGAPPS